MESVIASPDETRAILQGSFIEFCRVFYPILTGRDFIMPNPICREPHPITISRALTKCFRLISLRDIINLPPGHFKTTLLCLWSAWGMSSYPDSRFLYLSYSKELATKATELIRNIMTLQQYKILFNIKIKQDSKAKDYFQTTVGGCVAAFGSASSITGFDGGLPGLDRFSGAIIYDDPHKPDEASSDTVRQRVIENYQNTVAQRARGINVPIILSGQRVHEADLAAFLLNGGDGHVWNRTIIKALDDAGNALFPEAFPLDHLLKKQETDIYNFASQFQQDPQPAGGALYRPDMFPLLDEEPDFICTFMTFDTAETDKKYNDATAMSFWGLYKIQTMGRDTDILALHWINGVEIRVEPKDLEESFFEFWRECATHKTQPRMAAIEKKSTGVTLLSLLQGLRGLEIRNIERSRASGSKTQRFLNIQQYVAKKQISFTRNAPHVEHCIEHMRKITANDTHAHDDLCDTAADAVKFALIDKLLYSPDHNNNPGENLMDRISSNMSIQSTLRKNRDAQLFQGSYY